MKIENEKVVSFHYTLTDPNGEVLDKSIGQDPLFYLHGRGFIIAGLEKEMEGKSVGDKFKATIPAAEAYGERRDDLIQGFPKSEFEDATKIQVGSQFEVDTPNGTMILTVIEEKDEEFILDGNHPLAGVDLTFDVEVMEVRDATEEELSHGHAHGPGGHDHD